MTILKLLAAGMSQSQILSEYPYLEDDDIRASLEVSDQTRETGEI